MEWFHINRRMLVYKAWYFFSISAMSIAPFLSLHLKQFGMSPSSIGVLTFMKHFCVAIISPIIGFLTDKYRCPKQACIFGGIIWISATVVMGFFIPEPQEESCEIIQENLSQRFSHCSLSFLDLGNASNESGLEMDLGNDDRNEWTIEYNDGKSCHSIIETITSDRTWLYTADSLEVVFYMFLFSFCLLEVTFQTLHSITDAESLNALQDMDIDIADYGKQRAFGSLGWGIAPLVYGAWIASTRREYTVCGIELTDTNYSPMFILFVITAVVTMSLMTFYSFEYKQEQTTKSESGKLKQILIDFCTIPNIAVIFVLTFTGMCNGTLGGYVYWHLDNLGGTELVMGLASTCHGFSELLLGFTSGAAIRQFGHFPLITLGVVTYLVRFMFYSYVTKPWGFMASEIFHSLTFILTWNTTLAYLSLQIPEDYRTTLASFLSAMVHGVGAAFGYLLSGFLIQYYGSMVTFKIYAAMCAVVVIVFVPIFQIFSPKANPDNKSDDESIFIKHEICQPQFTTVFQQQQIATDSMEQ